MKHNNFTSWISVATGRILYGPDRSTVAAELRAHLEDHRDALIAKGMDEESATKEALSSMGSAEEIAPQLAQLHKPFWGYFLRINQILAAVLLILALLPLWDYVTDLKLYDAPHTHSFDVYDPASYTDSSMRVLHHLSTPDVSFSSEAGIFTVTNAAVFTTFPDENSPFTQLSLLVRQRSLLPWKEHEGYFEFDAVTNWFTARDSLGNVYSCLWDAPTKDNGRLIARAVQSGVFSGVHALYIADFPQDAQWVEILCTRDGREYVLHIDLTGGECP